MISIYQTDKNGGADCFHIFSVAQLKPGFKSSMKASGSVLSEHDVEMHIHWLENGSISRILMH